MAASNPDLVELEQNEGLLPRIAGLRDCFRWRKSAAQRWACIREAPWPSGRCFWRCWTERPRWNAMPP